MKRTTSLLLVGLLLAGCGGGLSESDAQASAEAAVAQALAAIPPTATSPPAPTAVPTYTPYPTYTALPTSAPLATHTSQPTFTPYPTFTPPPTATPLPTFTPYPTFAPAPTYTPWPTDASIPTRTPYETLTPSAMDTPLPPFTPSPGPLDVGMSRLEPFPYGEVAPVPGWDVQVLETMRGPEAWQRIQEENQFNDPPPEGQEYVLIKLGAKCTATDDEAHSIERGDFRLTGDRAIEYSMPAIVVPDPSLDAEVFAGGEVEGWTAFLVAQGEANLILIYEAWFEEESRRFIAVERGAAVGVSPELMDIAPTGLGAERSAPAPFGETITSEDWQITLLDVVRGEQAWQRVQEANQFNDPPAEGMEYVLVLVRARYIGTEDRSVGTSSADFQSTGEANVLYDPPAIVDPEPALDVYLFPGGQVTGWITMRASQDEMGMMLVFDPWLDFTGQNRRFLSLGE